MNKDNIENIKSYIKQLSISESKYLKSISFSFNEQTKEFIVYFTWIRENSDNYFNERDIFRNMIKSYLINNHFLFKIKKSNNAKFTFTYK